MPIDMSVPRTLRAFVVFVVNWAAPDVILLNGISDQSRAIKQTWSAWRTWRKSHP